MRQEAITHDIAGLCITVLHFVPQMSRTQPQVDSGKRADHQARPARSILRPGRRCLQVSIQTVLVPLFMELLESVSKKYPMKIKKPLAELADMLSSLIEGGIIMSKVLDDRHILLNQLRHYRSYIRLVFGDA